MEETQNEVNNKAKMMMIKITHFNSPSADQLGSNIFCCLRERERILAFGNGGSQIEVGKRGESYSKTLWIVMRSDSESSTERESYGISLFSIRPYSKENQEATHRFEIAEYQR